MLRQLIAAYKSALYEEMLDDPLMAPFYLLSGMLCLLGVTGVLFIAASIAKELLA